MPYTPPPNIQSLDLKALSQLVSDQSRPPVEKWQPEAESDSYMRIDRNGRWYHRGDEIKRPAMVRLFSTILRREEDGRFALVTPYEKQHIAVEDAPFLAVELSAQHNDGSYSLTFRLNTDELVIAGKDNPLRMEGPDNDPRFYLTVRPGLEALLSRTAHYDLVNLLLDQSENAPDYRLDYGGAELELHLADTEDAA
ncbi:DUF1285 domain-containing protein [Alterisphingorhabdus coralli]|uniref:DUF1285 domain-containing protein n=1 Tax=Alterisphingorhabdus coralli TaxID=3071408 RepID=A0AA97F6X6_9SPHN|nr:DUF1285 domain-containing protein [Parasphingorhabdus sp. SCSIO 66989]WOE74217.1 DUF1285 domain-containing protein [Parasphingorhabdus sp. SCSIO 66989]